MKCERNGTSAPRGEERLASLCICMRGCLSLRPTLWRRAFLGFTAALRRLRRRGGGGSKCVRGRYGGGGRLPCPGTGGETTLRFGETAFSAETISPRLELGGVALLFPWLETFSLFLHLSQFLVFVSSFLRHLSPSLDGSREGV